MTATAVPTRDRLPRGVAALLEAFRVAQPGVDVRLWTPLDGGWTRVQPSGAEDGAPPAPVGPMRALTLPGGGTLGLEVDGEADPIAARFLGDALRQAFAYEEEARSAAHELSEKYEEINLLYSISEILGSVLTLESAAGRILTEVADVLGARRASIWVFDPADGKLYPRAAEGEEAPRQPIPVDDPDSATAWVFRERQPLNLERGTALPRGTNLDPRPHGREAFLSVPISYTPPEGEARTVGVITLVGRRSNVRFTAGDARLLAAIASQVGAALETQRLMQESLSQERLMRELELAHDLQLKLLPDTSDFDGTADVAARCVPAESVGGDFYHLFRLSGDRLGVMIGDVSSHGFAAALIMALTMSAVAISAQESDPPAEVLRRVHAALIDELETTEMYLTLFYGVLDPAHGRLVYSNAGHPHAFALRHEGVALRLGATSPPLGIVTFHDYGEAAVPWTDAEDVLLLFTDGLSDAFGSGAAGEAALLGRVHELLGQPLAEVLERVFATAEGAELSVPPDDRTAVLVRV